MLKRGWVALYRKIRTHWTWEKKPFPKAQALLDLLLDASHQDRKTDSPDESKSVHLEPGDVLTDLRNLAERWGWSPMKVSRFIQRLVEEDTLRYIERDKFLHVNFLNWKEFQFGPWNTETQNEKTNETRTRHGRDKVEAASGRGRNRDGTTVRREEENKERVVEGEREETTGASAPPSPAPLSGSDDLDVRAASPPSTGATDYRAVEDEVNGTTTDGAASRPSTEGNGKEASDGNREQRHGGRRDHDFPAEASPPRTDKTAGNGKDSDEQRCVAAYTSRFPNRLPDDTVKRQVRRFLALGGSASLLITEIERHNDPDFLAPPIWFFTDNLLGSRHRPLTSSDWLEQRLREDGERECAEQPQATTARRTDCSSDCPLCKGTQFMSILDDRGYSCATPCPGPSDAKKWKWDLRLGSHVPVVENGTTDRSRGEGV